MLLLRDGLKQDFDDAQRKRFFDRMVEHLRKYLPDRVEALADAALGSRLEQELEDVANYRLVQEHVAAVYLCALIALEPDGSATGKPAWIQAALDEVELAPAETGQLIRYLIEADLVARSRSDDEGAEALHGRAVRLRAAAIAARREFGRNTIGDATPSCAQVGVPEEAVPPLTRSELLQKAPSVQDAIRDTELAPLLAKAESAGLLPGLSGR